MPADVQKELAIEEDSKAKAGQAAVHEISPMVFLVTSLELEDAQ